MPNVGLSKGPNPSASKPTDARIADATEPQVMHQYTVPSLEAFL